MHESGRASTLQELQSGLGLGFSRKSRKDLVAVLADLRRRESIIFVNKNQYRIATDSELHEGTLSMTPRGFGFVVLKERMASSQAPHAAKGESRDPFIAPVNLGTAHHGDLVLVKLLGKKRGREEAKVVRIINRASTRLVGTYVAAQRTGWVVPEEEKLLFHVLIRKERTCGAKNGNAVVVEIDSFKPGQKNPDGRIIEVLGDPGDLAVQTEIVIRKHNLPHQFSQEALRETEQLSPVIGLDQGRADLRGIIHVTIDGETARDFDDAVAVKKSEKGYRLHVSIADVSHYVQPGTVLDKEAYQRGTSVYFPNRVVPMLPERLSNDLCSLVPDQDRLAFTAIIDFDPAGKRVAQKFTRSIIRSRHRLTYTKVKKILIDHDPELRRQYHDMEDSLREMAELAAALENRRSKRGSLGFELPEPEITLTEKGEIESVARAERNLAHKLIEEFMLAANEAVAEALSRAGQPTLYRIHEKPDSAKVLEFTQFARSLSLNLPKETGTPHWFGKILATVAGTPKEYIVNNLLLRTMQRARYSPENVGHFGLAAEFYSHFTSPIRRYPDLIVHRTLTALLLAKGKKDTPGAEADAATPDDNLTAAGDFLSTRERVAVDAEREMTERLQVRFMEDKIGETFTGIISGVATFGLYIELLDLFIHGAIPIAELKGDYYQYDQRSHRLIGANSGRIFQMGDIISVRLTGVDPAKRHINFRINDTTSPETNQD